MRTRIEFDCYGRVHYLPIKDDPLVATTGTATIGEMCDHDTGWWQTIPKLFGRRRVYVCVLCMKIFDAETMKEV